MLSIASYIEHTLLKPTITDKEIDQLVAEAREYSFVGVCIPPFWVKRAKREAGVSDLKIVTVAGFPLGYNITEVKLEEIRIALNHGADEVDMVMNISAFKINMDWFKIELAKCSKAVHDREKILKVIIETAYLSSEEIIRACRICTDAGVDFVKTSTGFAPEGAKVSDVELMRKAVPASVGVKASGGIRDLESFEKFIIAGADRIGTSSGIKIMEEWNKKQKGI
jgi:deoxyribose-phosphate aldolase